MVFLFSPCWCWLPLGLLVLAAAGLRPVILTGGVLTRPLLGLALLLRLLCLASAVSPGLAVLLVWEEALACRAALWGEVEALGVVEALGEGRCQEFLGEVSGGEARPRPGR